MKDFVTAKERIGEPVFIYESKLSKIISTLGIIALSLAFGIVLGLEI